MAAQTAIALPSDPVSTINGPLGALTMSADVPSPSTHLVSVTPPDSDRKPRSASVVRRSCPKPPTPPLPRTASPSSPSLSEAERREISQSPHRAGRPHDPPLLMYIRRKKHGLMGGSTCSVINSEQHTVFEAHFPRSLLGTWSMPISKVHHDDRQVMCEVVRRKMGHHTVHHEVYIKAPTWSSMLIPNETGSNARFTGSDGQQYIWQSSGGIGKLMGDMVVRSLFVTLRQKTNVWPITVRGSPDPMYRRGLRPFEGRT